MSDHTYIGEQYNVRGRGNVGKVEHHHGGPDVDSSLRDLVRAVETLRQQVSAGDRAAIDASLTTVEQGKRAEPGRLRHALGEIAGVATVVGTVGAPVIDAVRRVMAALGS